MGLSNELTFPGSKPASAAPETTTTSPFLVRVPRSEYVIPFDMNTRDTYFMPLDENTAAGIDVFDNEPLAANHAYLELDNVIMTPHVAYNTPEAVAAMYDTAIDNLVAFYAGSPQNVATSAEI